MTRATYKKKYLPKLAVQKVIVYDGGANWKEQPKNNIMICKQEAKTGTLVMTQVF